MAAVSRDDPMDLGPFIQNWVLNNPFTNPLPLATSPEPQEVKSANVPDRNGKPTTSSPPPSSPTVPTLKGDQAKDWDTENSAEGGGDQSGSESGSDINFIVFEEETGKVIDTSKGHIGSNRMYAEMMRCGKLPTSLHESIRKWLLDNYRYEPMFKNEVRIAADSIIKKVHHVFPEIRGRILAHTMRVTFPNCKKIDSKSGPLYAGLIPKPDRKLLCEKKDTLLEAQKEVEQMGTDVDVVASIFHVPVEVLAGVIVWQDVVPLCTLSNVGRPLEKEKPHRKEEVSSRKTNPGSKQDANSWDKEEEYVPQGSHQCHSGSSMKLPVKRPSDVDDTIRVQPKRCAKSSHSFVKSEPMDRAAYSSSDESVHSREAVVSPAKRRKPKDNTIVFEAVGSIVPEDLPSCEGKKNGSKGNESPPAESIKVFVKEEPYDPDYVTSQANGSGQLSKDGDSGQPMSAALQVPNLVKLLKAPREVLPVSSHVHTGASSHSVQSNSVANGLVAPENTDEHTSLSHQLALAHQQLSHVTQENRELNQRIKATAEELNHSQQMLKKREVQISEMGAEFLELSNQFMLMSHRFRTVMQEIRPPQNALATSNGIVTNGK